MKKHLVLVGLMGSGKSTVARWLRRQTGWPLRDLDALIEKAEDLRVDEIFQQRGETFFRQREALLLHDVLAEPAGILATGGGTFQNAENRAALLRHGQVFYLRGSAEQLARRIRSTKTRPLLHGRDKLTALRDLLTAREENYLRAHHVVLTDGRELEEVAREVLQIYEKHQAAAGVRKNL